MRHFLDESPTPYHASQNLASTFFSGYTQLSEMEDWSGKLQPGGSYYFLREGTSIVAFRVGKKVTTSSLSRFKITAAHTDSPNLRLKPFSKNSKTAQSNLQRVNTECYGGGLWHTWFDRDLSVAGCVTIQKEDGSFQRKLVKINEPLLRIPNLAIHLTTADERKAFEVNKETHLAPLICSQIEKKINMNVNDSDDENSANISWENRQNSALMQKLATAAGCAEGETIKAFDLSLFDTQPASIINGELLSSARLDNLASCYVLARALAESPIEEDEGVSMFVGFDHEEVGSSSIVGAGSTLISDATRRIGDALLAGHSDAAHRVLLRQSFCLSVDQAHAIHPNYASKHEPDHAPKINGGLVIKHNANQRYSTNRDASSLLLREIASKMNASKDVLSRTGLQEFVVKNDCACGSTIGPILSTQTGITTVDVGMPSLSMHSIREVMGVRDVSHGFDFFQEYFKSFDEVAARVKIFE